MTAQQPQQHLNFTAADQLDRESYRVYQKIAGEHRQGITQFIGNISNGVSLDWWLEAPATRNQVYSQLFRHICTILTLRALLKQGNIPLSVTVDSTPLANEIRGLLKVFNIDAPVFGPSAPHEITNRIQRWISPFRSMARLLLEWCVIRTTALAGGNRQSIHHPIVLIDTFAIPGFVDNDRYFPHLYELSGEFKPRLRFAPQFLEMSLGQLRRAAQTLRKQTDKYLLKEDYIRPRDLLWCFGHWRRIKTLPLKNTRYLDIELKQLIVAEIRSRSAFRCALRGLVNYRFAKALSRAGVPIAKSIDWFENHPLDRGWNAGFNTFFPDINTVGYTGFFPAGQSYRPSAREYEAGILPKSHSIIGDGFRADMSEFFAGCAIEPGPALRYLRLPSIPKRVGQHTAILVAMPYYRSMCIEVMRTVVELAAGHEGWEFVVKTHPAQPLDAIGFNAAEFPSNIKVSDKTIAALLQQSAIMVSGAQASTIIEAAAQAVPTVIISNTSVTDEVSIPSSLAVELYQVCYDPAEAEQAIQSAMHKVLEDRDKLIALAEQFRRQSFYPVNDQTIGGLLAA